MKTYKLVNIQEGYAEVWVSKVGKFGDDDALDGIGYVATEEFVERSDFEKDEQYYKTRWVTYVYHRYHGNNGYLPTGKMLGYATRKEAVEALVKEILEVESSWTGPLL